MIENAVTGKPRERPVVLAAALRRLERAFGAPAPAAGAAAAGGAAGRPVFTLHAPGARDPAALARLLADDLAAKLDELLYVWSVIRELEPFAAEQEPSLRRRAAELALVDAGSAVELPIEPLLHVARGFLDAHGMDEGYIRKLCEWYRT